MLRFLRRDSCNVAVFEESSCRDTCLQTWNVTSGDRLEVLGTKDWQDCGRNTIAEACEEGALRLFFLFYVLGIFHNKKIF